MEHQPTLEQPVHCQSCGMPMTGQEWYGSEMDGSKNEEYCLYCYESGVFKQPEITLREMEDLCTGFLVKEGMPEDTARKMLADQLPQLKRWKTTGSLSALESK